VHLADVAGALVARIARGAWTTDLLARALAPLVGSYDLVVIDTPPVDTTLQVMALGAARWLLVPTKADASSIRGIAPIAERVVDARAGGHQRLVPGLRLRRLRDHRLLLGRPVQLGKPLRWERALHQGLLHPARRLHVHLQRHRPQFGASIIKLTE
jgi:cellulose biosynthesis protein BcsQ